MKIAFCRGKNNWKSLTLRSSGGKVFGKVFDNLRLAESSASFFSLESSYKGFTSMHQGRAELDYAVNRDRERVKSVGCSALLHVGHLGLFSIGGLLPNHTINPGTKP